VTTSSRVIVEQMLQVGRERNIDAVLELMAPDGLIEWPYRPAGVPAGVRGRAEIRRFLTAAANSPIVFDEYRDVVVHETLDPEVIIVEYEAHGKITTTGAPYRQTIIAVFRVRDGQIVSYRDYLNPLTLAEAHAEMPDATPVRP
jgi:ketosteroid isomerase-like protein